MEAYLRRMLARALAWESERDTNEAALSASHLEVPAPPVSARVAPGLHLQAWCGGRADFANAYVHERSSKGERFVALAALKESAANEFVRLAQDLQHHRAPKELIARALRGADETSEHFQLLCAEVRLHRLSVCPAPPPAALPPRTLNEVAQINLVRGVVGEQFAAVVCLHQARHATEHALRTICMKTVEDVSRHAAYALELHHWLLGQLSPARGRALAELERRSATQLGSWLPGHAPRLTRFLGLPSVACGLWLLSALRQPPSLSTPRRAELAAG